MERNEKERREENLRRENLNKENAKMAPEEDPAVVNPQ